MLPLRLIFKHGSDAYSYFDSGAALFRKPGEGLGLIQGRWDYRLLRGTVLFG